MCQGMVNLYGKLVGKYIIYHNYMDPKGHSCVCVLLGHPIFLVGEPVSLFNLFFFLSPHFLWSRKNIIKQDVFIILVSLTKKPRWWLLKNMLVNLDHFPQDRDEHFKKKHETTGL